MEGREWGMSLGGGLSEGRVPRGALYVCVHAGCVSRKQPSTSAFGASERKGGAYP